MKKLPVILIAAAALSANAATVRTATEAFVTNRVAAAANAATNYTDAAVADAVRLGENKPVGNARLVLWDDAATWENPRIALPVDWRLSDLVPGDYAAVSNAAMNAVRVSGGIATNLQMYGELKLWDDAVYNQTPLVIHPYYGGDYFWFENGKGGGGRRQIYVNFPVDRMDASVAFRHDVDAAANAATNYTAGSLSQFAATGRVDWAERAATIPGPERDWNGEGITHEFDKIERDLAEKATPAAVTNIVRDLSLPAAPLSGETYDFATTGGFMEALKAVIETLGGSVTNFPAASSN